MEPIAHFYATGHVAWLIPAIGALVLTLSGCPSVDASE